MASEIDRTGMTPEQKFGLAAGATFAFAGLAMTMLRRRKKKTPVQQTADKLMQNPSLKNLFSAARESLEEAKGKVDPKTFEAAKKELERQRETLPERWHSDIEPTAKHLAERALQTAQKFSTEGAELGRDLSKRWEKEYGPAAKSFADEAVHEADEILAAARKKATEISDTARKDYIPKLAPMATAATGAITEALSDSSGKVQKKMKGSSMPDISLPKRSQPNLIKRTGQGAVDVTSQFLMIIFWAAALGTVIYYGILDEEKREKVRNFFNDSWEQVSELIEDFKDEDVFDDTETSERF
jgi:HD-GYP domain-containing protein (c-di-GMP phosphodiesterase class II)